MVVEEGCRQQDPWIFIGAGVVTCPMRQKTDTDQEHFLGLSWHLAQLQAYCHVIIPDYQSYQIYHSILSSSYPMRYL